MKIAVKIAVLLGISSIYALDTADEQAIGGIVEHCAYAWNHNHGKGFADHYAEEAGFVNIFGMTFSGKQEIEDRHVAIHETFLKGSTFAVTDMKLREARPGVVIGHVYWKVSNIQEGGPVPESITGVFTHVFLKDDAEWKIISTQNTLSKEQLNK